MMEKDALREMYEAAMRLNTPDNDLYTVEPAPGEEAPYVKRWLLTYRGPTLVKRADGMIDRQTETVVRIDLYALEDGGFGMRAHVEEGLVPFHPNWFLSGLLANGQAWSKATGLVEYIVFVCEILQFKAHRINLESPANAEAARYYAAHRDDAEAFPVDARPVPVPEEPASRKLRIRWGPDGKPTTEVVEGNPVPDETD